VESSYSVQIYELTRTDGKNYKAQTRFLQCMTNSEITYSVFLSVQELFNNNKKTNKNQIPWLESASKLYQLSNSRLSAKLVPTFVNRGCRMVSATDPYCRILDFPQHLTTLQASMACYRDSFFYYYYYYFLNSTK
jgi:alpha-acetolactate decarboxylase